MLAWLLFALLSHYFYYQIGDDSFIYFRYVDRAVNGLMWSWADYSGAVEGYSSPLWYLLLVALGKLGVAVDVASRALGLLFAALTVQFTWLLARHFSLNRHLAGLACLLLVLNQGFHYWSTSGLETSLYMALFAASCLGIVRGKLWLLPTALLAIARPEGPFLLLALLVSIAVFRHSLLTRKNLFLLVLPLLLWLLTRWFVYHDVLPNTFYAKATGSKAQQILMGTIYSLPVLLPLLTAWLLWFKTEKSQQKSDVLVVLGMITMLLGIVVLGGGDWMFFMRLLLPCLALLWVVMAFFWQQGKIWQRLALICSSVFLLAASVPPTAMAKAFKFERLALVSYQEGNMTQQSIVLARQLEQAFGKQGLLAVNHAGALPWAMADYDVIDMVGLNDKHIAKAAGGLHQKQDADYVLSLKPDLIILNSRTKPGTDGIWYHPGYWQGETALVEHPDFEKYYRSTDFIMPWQWSIPFPYAQLLGVKQQESWILVYQRQEALPEP